MGKPTGFIEIPRQSTRPAGRSTTRLRRLARGLQSPVPIVALPRAGRALHGLRHPVLPPGVPARQPDPRLERPGLPGPLADRDRPAARDEQLPRVHRPLCPAPCEASCVLGINDDPVTIKAIEAASSTGPGRRAGSCPQPPEGRDRASGRRGRLRPGRPGRARSSCDGPGTRDRASSATTGSAGCSATASPNSRWRSGVLDRRLDQMGAEGVEFRTGVNVGVDVAGEELLAEFDAICLCGGATQAARPADPRPRAGGRPFRDGLPAASRTAASRATSIDPSDVRARHRQAT